MDKASLLLGLRVVADDKLLVAHRLVSMHLTRGLLVEVIQRLHRKFPEVISLPDPVSQLTCILLLDPFVHVLILLYLEE